MSDRPHPGVRKPLQTPANPSPLLSDDPPAKSAPRSAIWAEGKQSPGFQPMAFAEAGMLLAREAAGAALKFLSKKASATAAQIKHKDWRLEQRLGRAGRALPTAPGVARSLNGFAHCADAARRVLYAAHGPKPAPETIAVKPAPIEVPRPAPAPAPAPAPPQPDTAGDPDFAAIGALPRQPQAVPPRRPASQPASWQTPPAGSDAAPVPRKMPVLPGVIERGLVRVLAGSVLVFATPIGYGRALYRYLDGADLREIVADCHRMRIN